MSWLTRLAERQIAKARASGQLQGLKGEGKPLPDATADAFVSASDALAFRMMAEAGVLPQEITLKKQAILQRAHLATLTDEVERKAALSTLAQIELRQAIAEESRRKFLK